jgi:hypothetical protein
MSYIVHGKRYADYFPYHFALFHTKGTGPSECVDCSYHGKVGGIFMGYCDNCARDIYNGSRGPGMNKYSNVDIYRQINANSEYFKMTRQWSKKYIVLVVILFFIISTIWIFINKNILF